MAEKLTDAQVRHVAKLSRLHLSDQEVAQYAERLSATLDYVSKLGELDLDQVEPMVHATDAHNVLREDEPRPSLTVEQVLDNAPDQSPPFFKVPKVLGQGPSA